MNDLLEAIEQYAIAYHYRASGLHAHGCKEAREKLISMIASPAGHGCAVVPEYWLVTRDDGAEWKEFYSAQALNLHSAPQVFAVKPVGRIELPPELRAQTPAPSSPSVDAEKIMALVEEVASHLVSAQYHSIRNDREYWRAETKLADEAKVKIRALLTPAIADQEEVNRFCDRECNP